MNKWLVFGAGAVLGVFFSWYVRLLGEDIINSLELVGCIDIVEGDEKDA